MNSFRRKDKWTKRHFIISSVKFIYFDDLQHIKMRSAFPVCAQVMGSCDQHARRLTPSANWPQNQIFRFNFQEEFLRNDGSHLLSRSGLAPSWSEQNDLSEFSRAALRTLSSLGFCYPVLDESRSSCGSTEPQRHQIPEAKQHFFHCFCDCLGWFPFSAVWLKYSSPTEMVAFVDVFSGTGGNMHIHTQFLAHLNQVMLVAKADCHFSGHLTCLTALTPWPPTQGTSVRMGNSWPSTLWDSRQFCRCLITPDLESESSGTLEENIQESTCIQDVYARRGLKHSPSVR